MARSKPNRNGEQFTYQFHSFDKAKALPDGNPLRDTGTLNGHKIWQVGRATSAAELYFKAMRLEERGGMSDYIAFGSEEQGEFSGYLAFGSKDLIDQAYRSVQGVNPNCPQTVKILMSIGTGHELIIKPSSFLPSFLPSKKHTSHAGSRSKSIKRNLLADTRNYVDFFRFDGEHGLGTMAFDEWKGGETLELMQTSTEGYLQSPNVKSDIAKIARQLVECRRERSTWKPDTDRWERFCHGVEYACPESTCKDDPLKYKTRQSLQDHLKATHSIDPDELESELDAGKRFPVFQGHYE